MNLLLFGAPGVGKGTQSSLLVERQGMKHISTGDLFRHAIKNQTELGQKAKQFLDQGALVPDEVTIGMVDEVLETLQGQPFILDGFPRNVNQAEALESLLAKKNVRLDKVVSLEVPRETIIKRLTGRRVCSKCGAVYHTETRPPMTQGVCDECGGELIQRSDDQEEAIQHRLDIYESSTKPLKGYYQDKGILIEVDGTGTADDVYGRIETQLH